jgi:hypothetical protein
MSLEPFPRSVHTMVVDPQRCYLRRGHSYDLRLT